MWVTKVPSWAVNVLLESLLLKKHSSLVSGIVAGCSASLLLGGRGGMDVMLWTPRRPPPPPPMPHYLWLLRINARLPPIRMVADTDSYPHTEQMPLFIIKPQMSMRSKCSH